MEKDLGLVELDKRCHIPMMTVAMTVLIAITEVQEWCGVTNPYPLSQVGVRWIPHGEVGGGCDRRRGANDGVGSIQGKRGQEKSKSDGVHEGVGV